MPPHRERVTSCDEVTCDVYRRAVRRRLPAARRPPGRGRLLVAVDVPSRRPRRAPRRRRTSRSPGTQRRGTRSGHAPRHAWSAGDGSGSARAGGTRTYAGAQLRARPAGRRRGPTPGFAFTELIASWEATTPGDSWIEVEVRGRNDDGGTSSWDLLGRWASGDRHLRRTTGPASPTTSPPSTSTPGRSHGTGARRPGSCGSSLLPQAGHAPARASTMLGAMASPAADAPTGRRPPSPGPARRHRARRAVATRQMVHTRPLPAVGRRRRGLVLADLDLDGAGLLRRAAAAVGLPLGAGRAPRTRGSTTPPG